MHPETLTQRDRILQLLWDFYPDAVPLPEILRLGVAQYNARILELRRQLRDRGWDVKCETWREGRQRHSKFRLEKISSWPAPPARTAPKEAE